MMHEGLACQEKTDSFVLSQRYKPIACFELCFSCYLTYTYTFWTSLPSLGFTSI